MTRAPIQSEFVYSLICIFFGTIGFTAYGLSVVVPARLLVIITAGGVLGFITASILLALQIKNPAKVVRAFVTTMLKVVLSTYAILFVVIIFLQNKIAAQTSVYFLPQPISAEKANALLSPQVEAVDLTTPDGARLRGWLVHNSDRAAAPLVIYFDGSGSEASQMVPFAQKLKGWSVLLVNYRGFGLSEGTPSQDHAFADAVFLYDTFSQRPGVDASRMVAMGYSLGSGVAVYLAEQRPLAGAILAAPYDSLTLIGVKRPLIYAPLSGIMLRFFDSISRAPAVTSPLLCLIGSNDTTVPPEISRKLAGAWGGAATVKTYQGAGHGLLLQDGPVWGDIGVFLRSLE